MAFSSGEEELDTLLPSNNNALGLSKRALVGRLLFTGKQQLNINAVKETLYKSWSNYEQLHISDNDQNTFLFCFKEEEHATEVMLKSPWYVMNHLLCLQYWLPQVSVTELDFDRNPFWVQVHNLPLENLNKLSAAILLAKVGQVMEIEEPIIEGKIVRDFVRGRVQVDVTKPLPTGCWIPRVSLPKLWVFFRYEKLQDLCFNCGILGHERRDCKKSRVMASFNPNVPKYTHELSVQASKSVAEIVRGFERKKRRRTESPQPHQEEVRDENTQTEVERLMKEQEEKEHKEKEKAEAHLYTIIKVARDEDLAEQIGKDTYFDLVDHDKVRSFRVQKQMSFNNFKEVVAKEFDIQVQFQRFWLWAKRRNHTYRPNRPLTPIEEALSVGQLREVPKKVQNAELKLFLEVERGKDLRPTTPPKKKKDEILLFFKLYDPEKEELRYVGRLFVNSTSQPSEYLPRLNEMAGYDSNEEIRLYEEIKFEPNVMCVPIDKKLTFRASQLENGDIICFQKASAMDIEEHIRYPDVASYLEYVHNRLVVHFRSLDKPKEDDFCLEMSRLFIYDDVVERVAQQLGLEDPCKIRLTPHNCCSQQPKPRPIKYRGVEHLSDMLVHYDQTLHIFQTSDILYYEVLDIPLPELQGLKTLKVAFHHATRDEVVIHNIRLPKQSTVGDFLDDLKTKVELSHPQAELRLLVVFNHKIYKVFPPNEKIENINDQYWTLRAEEIPEEEKNLGSHDSIIHVYHFTKDTTQNEMHVQNFGEPFLLVIHECETLAEIKGRIQQKLQVPNDEFAKWKFAFISLGRPGYLQDSDIVSSRFQRRDLYGAWEQYLGLEHTDNAPKRSYAANQNRRTYEKPVKFYI